MTCVGVEGPSRLAGQRLGASMSAIRVSVVGQSGSGKSTFARRLSARLALPCMELDGVYHQEGWSPLSAESFRNQTYTFVTEHPSWVVDGNYGIVRPVVWSEATHVVWLDMPRLVFMRRLAARSLKRITFREELWNGNREGLRNLLSKDSAENVLLHAWKTYPGNQVAFEQAFFDDQWHHIRFIRVRNDGDVEKCLDSLSRVFEQEGIVDD